jgi:hypothetical protein
MGDDDIDGKEPFTERDMALFKDSPDGYGKVPPAFPAEIELTVLELTDII